MAPKKNNSKQNQKSTQRRARGRRIRRGVPPLDKDATAYAKLLVDPTRAPLAYPVGTSGDNGFLLRADSTIQVGYGATETGGFISITPGALGQGNAEIVMRSQVAGVATGAASALGTSLPGKTFLASNAQAARPVAMAVQALYLGTEFDRSGYIYYGHTHGAAVVAGTTYQVGGITPILSEFERTPSDIIEVDWKPQSGDMNFAPPAQAATDTSENSAVVFAFEGLTPAKGMLFKITVVWEWLPVATSGVSTPILDQQRSASSVSQVINAIEERGYAWARHAGYNLTAGMLGGLFAGMNVAGPRRNRIEL